MRSVETSVQDDITLVTIEAGGPLPEPVSGALDDPPRIFFDFTGVMPQARGTTVRSGGGAVRQVRIALFSTAPNVTRVALDLTRHETFRVNVDERQSGRIRILVGSQSAVMRLAPALPVGLAPAPPVPTPPKPESAPAAPSATAAGASPGPLPATAAPAQPAGSTLTTGAGSAPAVPSPTPTPPSQARRGLPVPESIPGTRLPGSEIEGYRRQLSGALERLESHRSVVAAIDLDQSVAAETLTSTAAEFRILRRILEATKPSEVLRPTHDLLIASCVLGAGAAGLRIEAARDNDLQVRRNAASAAAGALMLLDRACAALGCTGGR